MVQQVIEGIKIETREQQLEFAHDIWQQLDVAEHSHEFGFAVVRALSPSITQQMRDVDRAPSSDGPSILSTGWGAMIGKGLLEFSERNPSDAVDALGIWKDSITLFGDRAQINHGVKQFVIGGMGHVFADEAPATGMFTTMREHIAILANKESRQVTITPHMEKGRILTVTNSSVVK